METVLGDSGNETLVGIKNTDTKLAGKGGNDYLKGGGGDDLLFGGKGSDVLSGGSGHDAFNFTKEASAGDVDYILDFDKRFDFFRLGDGVTITDAHASRNELGASFNGIDLKNDMSLFDVKLTLHVSAGDKEFDQSVWLLDVIKDQGGSATDFNNFLKSLGYDDGIAFA